MLASPSDIERTGDIQSSDIMLHAMTSKSLLCSGFCSLVLLLLEEINFILFFIFQEGIDSTIVIITSKIFQENGLYYIMKQYS